MNKNQEKKLQKQIQETNLLYKSIVCFLVGIVGFISPIIPGTVLFIIGIKYLRDWYKS